MKKHLIIFSILTILQVCSASGQENLKNLVISRTREFHGDAEILLFATMEKEEITKYENRSKYVFHINKSFVKKIPKIDKKFKICKIKSNILESDSNPDYFIKVQYMNGSRFNLVTNSQESTEKEISIDKIKTFIEDFIKTAEEEKLKNYSKL